MRWMVFVLALALGGCETMRDYAGQFSNEGHYVQQLQVQQLRMQQPVQCMSHRVGMIVQTWCQ